jgi:hypothetical protein
MSDSLEQMLDLGCELPHVESDPYVLVVHRGRPLTINLHMFDAAQ